MPFWVWLLTGIAIGLVTAVVALKAGWLPMARDSAGPRPDPTATAPSASDPGVQPQAAAAVPDKPRYDFYSVLPEMETVVPESELAAQRAKPSAPEAASGPTDERRRRLFIQAGSFRSMADAEQMKAKLALHGVRATVVAVTINGDNWYRVRGGPFLDARELDETRDTLTANGIEVIALREVER